jgi:hypothetical protein
MSRHMGIPISILKINHIEINLKNLCQFIRISFKLNNNYLKYMILDCIHKNDDPNTV